MSGAYSYGLDGLLGVVMDGDVDGDLLAVVGDLLVEGALQDDLALGAEEALVRSRRRRTLLLVHRRPLDLQINTLHIYYSM